MKVEVSRHAVIRALKAFFSFAPVKITLLNIGSVLMTISGGLTLLLIIPLANLAGLDVFKGELNGSWQGVQRFVHWVAEIPLLQSLSGILLVFVLLNLCLASLAYLQSIVAIRLQLDYVKEMRLRIYSALISADWEYLSSHKTSAFLHRLSGQVQSVNGAANQTIALLHKLISFCVYVVLMLLLNWKFTLMTMICALIIAAILYPIRRSVRDAGEQRLKSFQNIFRLLSEHLSSLKMIKISASESLFRDTIDGASADLEKQQYRMVQVGAIVTFVNRMGAVIGFCLILYIAIYLLDLSVASYLLLFIIMMRLMPKVASLQQSIQQIIYSLPAFEDVEQTLLDSQAHNELSIDSRVERLDFRSDIYLDQVSFFYDKASDQRPVIENVSLRLDANKTYAFIGPSGAGKTTLADLIVGLLRPKQGKVLIDGMPLTKDNLRQWRRSLAYVAQDVQLFNLTVRDNIRWTNPDKSDDEIWRVLEMAAIKKRIEQMPEGLDTVLGEGGISLSGGERQRLAIARALLSSPDLLVLDEATSALDRLNEQAIKHALGNLKGSLTIIIIAHRTTTIEHADHVFDFSDNPPKLLSMTDYRAQLSHE